MNRFFTPQPASLSCPDCEGNVYDGVCSRCGLCLACGNLVDDCVCDEQAEERFVKAHREVEKYAD